MTDQIVQLNASDYEAAMDFMNLVFSVHGPIDFETLLPKLYRPTDEHMSMNYAVKRDGRIRAIVGLYPITLRLGEVPLRVAGIGGVSAHPRDRGQGHMKRLMERCLEVMRAEAYDLSWLGGQRQRYGYFGYEICGSTWEHAVTKTNLRHACAELPDITFVKITDAGDERLRAVAGWHARSAIRCERPADEFYDVATSWGHDLMLATDGRGEPMGYVVADRDGGLVVEWAGSSPEIAAGIVPAWVAYQERTTVRFEAPGVPTAATGELVRLAEYAQVRASGNWRVFDWETVVSALLRLRVATSGLASGDVTVAIAGHGSYRLVVSGTDARCGRTDRAPDFSVDPATAMRMLFGPLPPYASGPTPPAVAGWCPLPLHMPRQDEV